MKLFKLVSEMSTYLFTLPWFKPSSVEEISENSLGAPYMLMKHGPNVGRNPSACKSEIVDKGKWITAFVSSSEVLSLFLKLKLIFKLIMINVYNKIPIF